MERNIYRCTGCGVTMSAKPRFGSQEMMSGATDREGEHGGYLSRMYLMQMQSCSLGRTEVDKARKVDPENWAGWECEKDSPEHNFTTIYQPYKEEVWKEGRAICLRMEDGQDLVLKITIPDYKNKPHTPRQALDEWYKTLSELTKMERDIYFCYLTGGHHWEIEVDNNKESRDA